MKKIIHASLHDKMGFPSVGVFNEFYKFSIALIFKVSTNSVLRISKKIYK